MSRADDGPQAPSTSEDRYRLLVEGTGDYALFLLDAAGRVETWNAGAERISGYPAAEIVGRHVACLFSPEDVADGLPGRRLESAVADGRVEFEGWQFRKDGSRYWAHAIVTVLIDGAGRPSGFAVICRDLSGGMQSEEVLRSVLDNVVDGIITIDEMGIVQSFNPAAEKIFGYWAAEVLGRNVSMLMPEPHRSEHDGYIENFRRTGRARIIGIGREVTGRRNDGSTFPMELAVGEFRLNGRRFFTGIVRDITERKRLEHEVRRRVSELAESDRRKDEFLAMLAHELRNPLAAISSAMQLTGRFADEEESEWSMDVINRQVRHLSRLIDDLLDVSRITRGKIELRKEVVDVAPIVAGAVEATRPLLDERQHQVTVAADPGQMWLEADPTRLEQILSNLLNNAAKYTDNGGRIWVTASLEGPDVVLRVRDTGMGIPPEKLPQMFELFAQGDRTLARSEGGLGIGLTLVRALTELHGGSVTAASDGPGKGTEFAIRLPAADRPGGHSERVRPSRARRAPSRVLIVDDNVDLARSLARLLTLLGHEVRMAYDGEAGLEEARSFRPDVVLLDIGLPRMDGYQVARLLREEDCGRDARIIAITGYGHDEDRRRSREAGIDYHLVKPIDYRSLMPLLESAA
ncbi:PAS domain-containing hybrid sensor histidine kinase/response regulator [Aquisphaera giovannonii]|nr:PAS domain S-box protein [Aquisphaera giovannonii]